MTKVKLKEFAYARSGDKGDGSNVGIFVTMNPGYAGRSQLPDNLKALFRPLSMAAPDRENIAEVMLFVRGFRHAEQLSRKVVPLFRLQHLVAQRLLLAIVQVAQSLWDGGYRLHSAELAFQHPESGERVTVRAPRPD